MSAQLALTLEPPSGRYWVTTRLSPDEITAAVASAKLQEEAVLALFRRFVSLTPSAAHAHYCHITGLYRTPLTSIRRAIHSLTEDRALVKSDVQRHGDFGKPEHVWILRGAPVGSMTAVGVE